MKKWIKRVFFLSFFCCGTLLGYQIYYADTPLYECTLNETELERVKNEKPDLVVDKDGRRIYLVKNGELSKRNDGAYISWPISLGRYPVGTKRKEGDEKTPEGLYKFTDHYPLGRYYGSLWIHYPSEADAKRGQKEGLLSQNEYNDIAKAEKLGTRPPYTTRMGGQILIHGTHKYIPGTKIQLPSDTIAYHPETNGCVGMSNRAVFEMREHLNQMTGFVLIVP